MENGKCRKRNFSRADFRRSFFIFHFPFSIFHLKMNSAFSHYCQKCRAANQIGERNCRSCGTRLMLVVFPPSTRHDDSITPTFYEDHLLERVSLLELHLAQTVEKIGMLSEVFAREAKELRREQKFVRAFADALRAANPQLAEALTEKYESGAPLEAIEKIERGGREQILKEILARHDDPNAPLFSHLFDEGVRLLDGGEEKQAFQMLERAALLSPQNVLLFVFIAENYYRADKYKEAKIYLEKAFELAPDNERVLLLLGAICADAGDAEHARKFLSVLANDETVSPLVHFIWGMLAAFEENWTEALAAFKQAAAEKSIAVEIDFLIGSVYFELERYDAALQCFQKSVAADFKFSDAWLMQSLIYKMRGENDILETLAAKTETDYAHNLEHSNDAPAFRHFKSSRKNLLTGGTARLSRFFREQIFKAIESKNR